MQDQKKLIAIFLQFANREVSVAERNRNFEIDGEKHLEQVLSIAINDTAVAELTAAVEEIGYSLRTFLPNSRGTTDHRRNRANVHIERDDAGVYRMSRFRIG